MRYSIRLARFVYKTVAAIAIRFGVQESKLRTWLEKLMRFLMKPAFMGSALVKPISVDGFTVYWKPCLLILDWAAGKYERGTTRLITNLLQPGMAMVDIGAHIGYYTLLGARAVYPKGHIYALEPDPSLLQLLRKNVKVNGYEQLVTIVPKACTSSSGKASFYEGSLYTDINGAGLSVDTISLDEFFSAGGWPRIDLVKMDIEGAEKEALDGMRELSKRNPWLKLIVEFNPVMMDHASVEPKEFFGMLQTLGFRSFSVIHDLPREGVTELSIPDGISPLVHEIARIQPVNLLCER